MPKKTGEDKLRLGEKRVTAKDILDLLALKHCEDVFIPECKDGQTGEGGLRMDAWTMKKSWTQACVTAYEIKVSRSDFLGDEKWRLYLPYCNEFYFVCPHGVIRPDELPPEAGLYCVSSTGTMLYRKKKCVRRTAPIPEDVYRYILMWRTKVARHYDSSRDAFDWKTWGERKAKDRDLGHVSSRKVKETLRSKVFMMECEVKKMQSAMDGYDDVRKLMSSLGLNPDLSSRNASMYVKERIATLKEAFPTEIKSQFKSLHHFAGELLTTLDKHSSPNVLGLDDE